MADLTSDDKVALLLSTLAPEDVEPVLGLLPPAHSARIRTRLQTLKAPPPEEVRRVSREFFDILRIAERAAAGLVAPSQLVEQQSEPAPNAEPAKPPEEQAVEAQPGPSAESASQANETPLSPAEALRQFSPETLVAALRGERAATVALVLGGLEVPQASAALKLLPAEVRHEAAIRLGKPVAQKPELVERILRSVLARCQELASRPAQPTGDQLLLRLADLVRGLGREDRKEILSRLEKSDPAAAEKVRRSLYSFADILRVDDRTMQTILGDMSTQTLALAIKGASEELKAKVMNNVSKRARETIQEEMELVASASQAMVEQAQAQFVEVLQRLDQEGTITL